jgi:signal transduction histidine kinase
LDSGSQTRHTTSARSDRPAPQPAVSAWREKVLDRTQTVAAILAPPIVLVTLLVRSASSSWWDIAVLGGFGCLLPSLRFLPTGSLYARGALGLAGAFVAAIYVVARVGLGAGVNVALASMCTVAVVYFGRRLGYLLVGLVATATITIGLLVTNGSIALAAVDVDPLRLQNWIRVATTNALLSALLVTVIDFVIRQLEASSRVTSSAFDELRVTYGQLGLLHRKLEAAKEEERRFIAHELHDELGQSLTALKLRMVLGGRGDLSMDTGRNQEALELVDQLIQRVRTLSGDLRPPLLDEVGLVPALRAYVARQSALTAVPIELAVIEPEEIGRLSPDLEIACFRIVQESLTNALRHAAPHQVSVAVARDGARIALSIHDDGAGFDATPTLAAAAAGGHLGVVGMRERVRGCGGTFHLRSTPAAGTTVEAILPIATAH